MGNTTQDNGGVWEGLGMHFEANESAQSQQILESYRTTDGP